MLYWILRYRVASMDDKYGHFFSLDMEGGISISQKGKRDYTHNVLTANIPRLDCFLFQKKMRWVGIKKRRNTKHTEAEKPRRLPRSEFIPRERVLCLVHHAFIISDHDNYHRVLDSLSDSKNKGIGRGNSTRSPNLSPRLDDDGPRQDIGEAWRTAEEAKEESSICG